MPNQAALIHNVYFWLRKDLTPWEREHFESELTLLAQTSYLAHAFIGKPAATEVRPVTDHSFDYSTSFHFKSMADHEFYQKDCPDHARFVANCKPFFERVVVYDVAPLT